MACHICNAVVDSVKLTLLNIWPVEVEVRAEISPCGCTFPMAIDKKSALFLLIFDWNHKAPEFSP